MRSPASVRALAGGLAACVLLAGCGGGGPSSARSGGSATGGVAVGPAVGSSKKSAGTRHEVADPLEASSYPAPAGVRHASAASPSKAGEAVVAAGAPSDAEVKAELQQMQAVEKSAKEAQHARLQPVPGGESIGGDGQIPIPTNVPEVVQKVVAGANEIADFPYVYGGGHASFIDNAYDCSGSVSYALAAGGLLSRPETSGELESWGAPGPGRYITVYANAGHTYMYVDGILYDTAGRSGVYASRWQVTGTDNSGYVVRHYPGVLSRMTHLLATLVLALDGESAVQGSTGLAVISLVSIVSGYVLLFCLWHFVFSAKARRRRGEKDPPP